jgi:dipeptidyl aminopeptidase/acylaminoacyl peptidase
MTRKVLGSLRKTVWLAGLGWSVLVPAWAQAPATEPAPAAVLTAPVVAPAAPAAALPPVEAYARLPRLEWPMLSPDGQSFAAIMNVGDNAVVAVRALDGAEPLRAVMKTDNREQRFAWLRWVNNQRLVMSLHFAGRRRGVETTETRLVAVDRDGSHVKTLAQPAAFTSAGAYAQIQDNVVDWLPEDGHHILLQSTVDGTDISPAVFRVNVDTGTRELVHGRRHGVRQWMTDGTHRVRLGVRQIGTQMAVLISDPSGENWRTAWTYELFDHSSVEPLGFGADVNQLFVLAEHQGRRAVFEVDLRDPALPRKLLLASATGDVSGSLVREAITRKPVGMLGGAPGDGASNFWDADAQALVRAIDAALPGRNNRLLQFSGDGSRYLLYSSGNGLAGQFMVGDRAGQRMSVLGRQYPELADGTLARKQALAVTARDGLKLPVFLTLPAGLSPQQRPQKLPLVLLPHGGPISRDGLDFDPLASFLASRGYAVLQVNFRGSAGLGFERVNAGLKRWGLEMQDDLTDAVQWAVQRGTADPARVCIVGGSYGGYAALMGGAKTPDLYRCVVSLAGVSDLIAMATFRAHYVNGADVFSKQVGSAWDDRQQLKDTSPQRMAANFQVPVLLLHGTDDRVVPFEQSQGMADALKSAGKAVRLVKLEDGDHALSFQSHRLQFYSELEAFLAANLGPGATPRLPR